MADYLNIAGRIKTTAADGVALEAQEVKDLEQNKFQTEINADVQTELADRYTKQETYSKQQLDNLITSPDVNYVSVVATDQTTDVTDVLPDSGEADTIYRVGNWNGSQYDTTVYSLYAWNGSAYVCLAVRSFVGEVYNISVNHPDGQGNPTPYADLAAALGTNGENIPADIRCGGMSIKFIQGTVQTYDNTYVQYMLVKNGWSASKGDWQKLNLEEELSQLGQKVDGNVVTDKAIYSSGAEVDATGYYATIFIPVQPSDSISYLGGFNSSSLGNGYSLVAYRADKSTMVDYWGSQNVARSITAPANTAYIRATFLRNSPFGNALSINGVSVDLNFGIWEEFNNTKTDAVNESNAYTDNVAKRYSAELGGAELVSVPFAGYGEIYTNGSSVALDSGGDPVVNTSTTVKHVIVDCVAGDKFTLTGKGGGSTRLWAFTDSSWNILSKAASGASLELGSLVAPENSVHLIVNSNFSTNPESELFLGVPYYKGVDKKIEDGDNELQEQINNIVGRLIDGYFVSTTDGNLVANDSFYASIFIPVQPGDIIKYLCGISGATLQFGLVSYNGNKVKTNSWIGQRIEREITLGANDYYIRASFQKGTDFYLKINDVPIELLGDTIQNIEEYTNGKFPSIGEMYEYVVAKNVFGDVLPPLFKQKFYPADKDILVVCQGDSLTGLIEKTSLQPDPSHCPPGQQYRGWITLLQERVGKIKTMCDRLDSQRDGADFFAKVGTWQNVIDIQRQEIYYSDSTTYGQERSVSALTFQCADNLAEVSFVFDADTYDKCNLVFSKEPDGVLTKVVIAEGNGKMLASLDRTTWVEANGLQVTQRTFDANGDDYTSYTDLNAFTNACATNGIATRERHRRIWMKKVEGVTGEINISYQRDNSISYADSYMYVWGVERYSGNTIFFDNIGRGGRETDKLSACVSDVFDRNPDLCIYEMPLANETDHTLAELKATPYYGAYFLGSGENSFKTRSADYTSVPILVVLPHGRSGFFNDENDAIHYPDQPSGQPVAYNFYKQMYGWLMWQLASYQNVKFVNLYDQLINEIRAKGYTIKDGTQGAEYAITADGVHLNDYGSFLWMAYLAPLFQ